MTTTERFIADHFAADLDATLIRTQLDTAFDSPQQLIDCMLDDARDDLDDDELDLYTNHYDEIAYELALRMIALLAA